MSEPLALFPTPLDRLRRQVRALERGGTIDGSSGAEHGGEACGFRLGVTALDAALPWGGLARGSLHEIAGAAGDGAAAGFASALVVRLLRECPDNQAVLWCQHRRALGETGAHYGLGLAALGLDPRRLVLVRVTRAADVLWALREGLGCRHLAAVVGEGAAADLTGSRRLQLAAEASGVTAFLLQGGAGWASASAALTRWQIEPAPSMISLTSHGVMPAAGMPESRRDRALGFGPARWRAHLTRCRGGRPRSWLLEWHHETGDFALAAPLSDRSAEPAAA